MSEEREQSTVADRLEVLREFNQLIAASVGLERLSRTVVRQAAFRFSADCAVLLLLSEGDETLKVAGSFGFAADAVPACIALENTLMGRALRLGGIMTVPDLTLQAGHSLDFLSAASIVSVHTCTMETKAGTLGALLIGYKGPRLFDDRENAMFEEFNKGATAAVAAASSQARLEAYASKLEELVQRRTADLENQKLQAEEANRAKSRFVANMSHELRTPLTAVIGYSSVVADGVFGPVNDKQKEALGSISRSSEHLKELIDEVLNLSRIEAGKEDPEPSKVELYSLLQQTYKLMLQTAVGKEVQLLALAVPEDMRCLKLWVDPRHIRQVLLNLMSNAIKYTPTGGSVRLEADLVGDKVKLKVTDTGVGIPKELQDRLFGRFERGTDSYSRDQVGTGIGLSLTKHLIEINGGRIGVESTLGEGSTFWVLVPLAENNASAEVAPSSIDTQKTARLDGLNILVVDDNKLTLDVLDAIIAAAGGTAYIADTVAEAKRIADKVALDAALIDLAIPHESGADLIQHFRKNCVEPLSTMPIVVISACVFEADRAEAQAAGASHFIPKPFQPDDVVRSVRNLTTESVLRSSFRLKVYE